MSLKVKFLLSTIILKKIDANCEQNVSILGEMLERIKGNFFGALHLFGTSCIHVFVISGESF